MNTVTIELVAGRTYSAPEVGAYWKKKGDRQTIISRNLRDWDVHGGIKQGKLKVIEEAE